MLLIPLLVGVAILTVAVMSRAEAQQRRAAFHRLVETKYCTAGEAVHPLRKAFPHLEFWIPSDELLGRTRAVHGRMTARAMPGAIGPDIIVGPWTTASRRQEDAHADAA